MSKPKNLTAYPTEYFELFRRAANSTVPPIILETQKQADELRLWLYGFRRALLAQPEADPELALVIEIVEVRVQGSTVSLRSRDRSETADAIRAALGQH